MLDKLREIKRFFFERLRVIPLRHFLILLLVLAFFYIFIWFVISKQSGWKIIDVIERMQDIDIEVTYDDYENIGFPDSFSTRIENLKYANSRKTFGWKTEAITVYPPLLEEKYSIDFEMPYDQFFSFRLGQEKDIERVALRNHMCQSQLLFDQGILDEVNIKSIQGILQFAGDNKTYRYDNLDLAIKSSDVIFYDQLEDIIEVNLKVKNIEPPKFWKDILESNFVYLKTNIFMRHPSSLKSLPFFERYIVRNYDPPELIIDEFALMHRLSLIGLKGILKFDTNMQLNGDLTLTISDYNKLLQFLTKKGVLSTKIAMNMRFMFSFLFSTKAMQKNTGSVDVPLRVEKNVVYSDKVKLFELGW